MFKVPENKRKRFPNTHPYYSSEADGNNGVFEIFVKTSKGRRKKATCVASDGLGWEHVSVSMKDRCLTWDEMCQIKDIFWGDNDCVMQYHPPKNDYVNIHPFCLHLWRPMVSDFPTPPNCLV